MSNNQLSVITLKRVLVYIRQHRRQIIIFMVCIAISILLWLMIKLNRHYVQTVTFRINLSGLMEDRRLRPLQRDTVVLEIKAQGYQLLFNEMMMARSLTVDFSQTLLKQSPLEGIVYIPTQTLLARISTQLPVSTELLSIKPDTLFFRVEALYAVNVPVIPDLAIHFAPGFNLYDTLVATPDSATIKGDRAAISGIRSVRTRFLDLKQVEGSFKYRLNLINPLPGQVEIQPKEISVEGKVSRFTEKVWVVQVGFADTLLRLGTPRQQQVEFRCMIPVEEAAAFNHGTLEVIAGSFIREGGTVHALLETRQPAFVKQIRLVPSRIILETQGE